ncbi:MAG: amidase [Novosphingobium sp.]
MSTLVMPAMAQAVLSGDVSAEVLVNLHLSRLSSVNPAINAVFQIAAETALEQARGYDRLRSTGARLPPLAGVPCTIKDSFDTAGMISTAGTEGRRGYVPGHDATVVERLRQAGAIVLGKSNTSELTLSFETDNLVYGRTNNPYDLARTPGGSSGGAAAVVASCGAAFDIGSDTAGSLRVPAHYCGLASLKPTVGRVPRTGHIISDDDRTQIGPISRHVEDLSLLASIIEGPDGVDPLARLPARTDTSVSVGRIAYFASNGFVEPDSMTASALAGVVDFLRLQGIIVEEAMPPAIATIRSLRRADREWIEQLLREAGTKQVHHELHWIMEPPTPGRGLPHDVLLRATEQFRAAMGAFMSRYDALVCPVRPSAALPHGDSLKPEHKQGRWYTAPFNLTGWPVVTVRIGTTANGLPIGVQIASRCWREDQAIDLATKIERWSGGWVPPKLFLLASNLANYRSRSILNDWMLVAACGEGFCRLSGVMAASKCWIWTATTQHPKEPARPGASPGPAVPMWLLMPPPISRSCNKRCCVRAKGST